MNPVNINNNEFQSKNHKQYNKMFTNFINLEKSIKNHENIKFAKIDNWQNPWFIRVCRIENRDEFHLLCWF